MMMAGSSFLTVLLIRYWLSASTAVLIPFWIAGVIGLTGADEEVVAVVVVLSEVVETVVWVVSRRERERWLVYGLYYRSG